MLSIGLACSYLALLVPWISYIWTGGGHIIKDPGEQFMLKTGMVLQIGIASVYALVGPILETFSKTQWLANGFLEIKTADLQAREIVRNGHGVDQVE